VARLNRAPLAASAEDMPRTVPFAPPLALAFAMVVAVVVAVPAFAAAQPARVDFHTDRSGAVSGYTRTLTTTDGDLVLSFPYRGTYAMAGVDLPDAPAQGVALLRIAPDGRARWVRDLRRDLGRTQNVSSIRELPGGALLLDVQNDSPTLGHLTHAELVRIEPDGRIGFRLADPNPTATSSSFAPRVTAEGDILLVGHFRGGSYTLRDTQEDFSTPYVPSHFLALVDGRSGAVRWQRTMPDRFTVADAAVAGDEFAVASKDPRNGTEHDRAVELFRFDVRTGVLRGRARYHRAHRHWIHGLRAYGDGYALLAAICDRQADGFCRFPADAVILDRTLAVRATHRMGVRPHFLDGPADAPLRTVAAEREADDSLAVRTFRVHTLQGDQVTTATYRTDAPVYPGSLIGRSTGAGFTLSMAAHDQRGLVLRSPAPGRVALGPARAIPEPPEPTMTEAELDHTYGAVFGAEAARTRIQQRERLRNEGVPDALLRQMGF
tara:strand:- start:1977 stop:3455 length:1479 start_codon:yes stop_codon:yes gene_type:complete